MSPRTFTPHTHRARPPTWALGVLTAAGVCLAGTGPAQAQMLHAPTSHVTASSFSGTGILQDDVAWLTQVQRGTPRSDISLLMTTTEAGRGHVGYTTGSLTTVGGTLSGTGQEYRNDRTFKMPPPPADGSFDVRANNPFDPDRLEDVRLTIDPATAHARLYWGTSSTAVDVDLTYLDGTFYGFSQTSPHTLYAIVLKQDLIRTIP